ncbi:hypothetical protein CNBB1140 [Cryptococcus deneoformans B-3501A]|uniref:NmrA-like domain-containing protein n=1 Tax=Cryptococcus deneoformans (strain JEC21 / ATCC MYA-565) TaxID=214684 RepID=Q5KLN7_CRYD1|nr:conserved hypothetical protein [Cryptococcus neoformans var. neoformans JEC21]XP_777312.1 hypothetical protein CNBB1140 [Cryptococcus neoformans var. neoformans B-3501A]AAW41646.1 conserved hypothetical protein [Cryptococcus neoformans var. neoformans JEC21]EAL22665.1 hypothetical protein CNBB1140 [Cryptococcus neoformans var. neoformans B-3501A]
MSALSNASKSIVVFTATGKQGSSVARTLSDAGYKIIALTRNPDSASAQRLKAKGYQVVKADLNDPQSYKEALEGAYGAFVNTDFWSILPTKNSDLAATQAEETLQGIAALQACKEAGLKHIVYATLDDGTGVSHWQSKADVSKWGLANNVPLTNLVLSFFFDNLSSKNLRIASPNDPHTFIFDLAVAEDVKLWGFSAAQTGLWVKTALENPDSWIGKDLQACTDFISLKEMAAKLSKLSGKNVKSNGVSNEIYESQGFIDKVGKELWDNFSVFYKGTVKRDIKESINNAPGAWDFESWAEQNDKVKEILEF